MSSNTIGGSLLLTVAILTIKYYVFEKSRFDKIDEKFKEIDKKIKEIDNSLIQNKRDKHDNLMRIVNSKKYKRGLI